MSKLIVQQVVARAMNDINITANEAKMDPKLRIIQDAFRNSPTLAGWEQGAELCGLLTGFRPRTSNVKVPPFVVFGVMSKAEQRVTRWAITMLVNQGVSYGCSSLSEQHIQHNAETCRVAEPAEAEQFINNEVATWEDSALLGWINTKLGATYYAAFFAELDRTPAQLLKKS